MRCPACGVYHPPLYDQCVSCGTQLGTAGGEASTRGKLKEKDSEGAIPEAGEAREVDEPGHHSVRRSKVSGRVHHSGLPTLLGFIIAVVILLVSAGATIFFLTRPSDDERLFQRGQKELANGQYAFAVKTLEQASAMRPEDARIFLALARAYVGIDQIDKAWGSISQAQQLGHGVAEEPVLASDLANYYRQRQEWARAAELLRPLAQAGMAGKKAELADLDALWGDECIRDGELDQALKCWEEVRTIGEGSRTSEVDSRLATIYQKFANKLMAGNDDAKALDYLAKLNVIAPSAANYERAADIYERQGQLELAIDQLRKAGKLEAKTAFLDRKLALLMVKRGKELLDSGDSVAGYGYLQEARSLDAANVMPLVALRSVNVSVAGDPGFPQLAGDLWNPGPNPVSSLALKVQLVDSTAGRVFLEKEEKLIDEFVPPLPANEARSFNLTVPFAVKANGLSELKVFIDGALYKSYPIGVKQRSSAAASQGNGKTDVSGAGEPANPDAAKTPLPAPSVVPIESPPSPAPPVVPPQPSAAPSPAPAKSPEPGPQAQPGTSEERTLKDLEL